MDFVAPPLLGYAGGAGLLEYTGAGAEAGTLQAAIVLPDREHLLRLRGVDATAAQSDLAESPNYLPPDAESRATRTLTR